MPSRISYEFPVICLPNSSQYFTENYFEYFTRIFSEEFSRNVLKILSRIPLIVQSTSLRVSTRISASIISKTFFVDFMLCICLWILQKFFRNFSTNQSLSYSNIDILHITISCDKIDACMTSESCNIESFRASAKCHSPCIAAARKTHLNSMLSQTK